MVVGICSFELFMPYNQSLKEKRHSLGKLKDRILSQLKVVVNEVGNQDLWQRASLGFAVVGSDESTLDSLITRTMNAVQAMHLGEITREDRDMIHYE